MKTQLLLSFAFLIFTFKSIAQDYNYKVIQTNLNKEVLTENSMNWLFGYSRTSKIKKLKQESNSGESAAGDEDFISWNDEKTSNILISNNVRFRHLNIKYNVLIKNKDNTTLIIIRNVFWRNVALSEKVPFTPIELMKSKESIAAITPPLYSKMLVFFNEYIEKEIYSSLTEYLRTVPIQYEGW